ncbi:MAG: TetR/AcrR family transcriptional regulator [Polyangiaceae bacterium]|nr:TetR/AcrR family transcriptional regulator [Polyangiaceae bacterium]
MPRPNAQRPLSQERIARAALKLVDRAGLEAFSMHKLGAALSCEAMSLYYHFKGRGEVLDAVAELLMAQVAAPADGSWQARLHGFATSYRNVALKHPRAFPLLATRPVNRPAGFGMLESVSATLRSAGFEPETAGRLVLLIGCWCNGALLAEIAGSEQRPEPTASTAPALAEMALRYPNLVEMAPYLSLCDFQPAFEFGIASLIQLVENQLAARS